MTQMFHLGGPLMWPVFFLGLLSIAAALRYALWPERRYVPLVAALGVSTLLLGMLGFASGVAVSFLAIGKVGPDERWISVLGVGESLSNVVLALALAALAALAVTVGTWRGVRQPALRGA